MRRKYMTQTEVATYTVRSTANNATVYFDGVAVGKIGGGQLIVTKKGSEIKDSFNVTLNGALPASSSGYTFTFFTDTIDMYEANPNRDPEEYLNNSFMPTSTKTTTTYTHTSGSVTKNGRVTLNPRSTTVTENVDWTASYNDTSFVEAWIYMDQTGLIETVNGSYEDFFKLVYRTFNGTKTFGWDCLLDKDTMYFERLYSKSGSYIVTLTQAKSGKTLQIPVYF